MLSTGVDKSACQAQAAKQEQTEPDEHFVPFLSVNPDVALSKALSLGNSSGHLVSPGRWFAVKVSARLAVSRSAPARSQQAQLQSEL